MTKQLLPGATIGIVGAGQLGKMLGQSAQKMGYKVAMFDPNPSSCGFAVSNWHTVGNFDDREALLDFAQKVDVLTYEFENINAELLGELAHTAYLPQGIDLLLSSQHRVNEKEWLTSLNVPVAKYRPIETLVQLEQTCNELGFPAILKSARFGYDGKGQIRLNHSDDLKIQQESIAQLLQQLCVLEAFCPFEYEVSVMVARDCNGHIEVFPISHNQHCNGILYSSLVPANVPTHVSEQITHIAHHIAQSAELIGVCGIEFFVLESGEVFVNELAPRPHNTGHYSIEACNVSQFDQHILAITGRPIVPVHQHAKALMINILGQHMPHLPEAMRLYSSAMFHLYDKGAAAHGRKMGHFTLLQTNEESLSHLLNDSLLTTWRKQF